MWSKMKAASTTLPTGRSAVFLVDAGEEDQQTPSDVGLDQRQYLRNPREAEQRCHACNRDHGIFRGVERLHGVDQQVGNRFFELAQRTVVEELRRLEIARGEADVLGATQPVGERVGQVAPVPAVPCRHGRLLEQSNLQPELPLVLLVVHGDPDPLRSGEVPVPGHSTDSLVILAQRLNSSHGRVAPLRV
jgi:hypothetical protein